MSRLPSYRVRKNQIQKVSRDVYISEVKDMDMHHVHFSKVNQHFLLTSHCDKHKGSVNEDICCFIRIFLLTLITYSPVVKKGCSVQTLSF